MEECKEIIANSKNDIIEKLNTLASGNYIKYKIKNNDLCFDIVVEKLKCKVFGGVYMELDNDVKVHILDIKQIWKDVNIPTKMIDYYIEMLEKASDEIEVFYIYLLMKTQLMAGDIITIEKDGAGQKKAIIQEPTSKFNGQIAYKLIKKNGEVGSREYLLYGKSASYNYWCDNREYIDYELLK